MNIKFSIIVPVYNADKYLNVCIDSIINQSYKNLELICIDDGSKDSSLAILNQYSNLDKRIKVYHIDNSGPAKARNIGLDKAQGDYIIFVDADDFLQNNALEIIYENILQNEVDVVVFGANVLCLNSVPQWIMDSVTPKDNLYLGAKCVDTVYDESSIRPFIWNKAYKKNALIRNGICFNEDIILGEDQAFLINIFQVVKSIKFISAKLYNYRWQRKDSIMTTYKNDYLTTTQNHLLLIQSVIVNSYKNKKLFYRINETMQWAVALFYNSSLKDLNHNKAIDLAKAFKKIIHMFNIDKAINVDGWDTVNQSAWYIIEALSQCNKKQDVSIVIYENACSYLDEIIDNSINQKNINKEVIILCFTKKYYDYVREFKNNSCIKCVYLPQMSFEDAKNTALLIANSNSIIYKSYENKKIEEEKYLFYLYNGMIKSKATAAIAVGQNMELSKGNVVKFYEYSTFHELDDILFDLKALNENEIKFKSNGKINDLLFIMNTLNNHNCYYHQFSNRISEFNISKLFENYDFCAIIFDLSRIYRSLLKMNKEFLINDYVNLILDCLIIERNININTENCDYYMNIITLYELVSKNNKIDSKYKIYLEKIIEKLEQYDYDMTCSITKYKNDIQKIEHSKASKIVKLIEKSKLYSLYKRLK